MSSCDITLEKVIAMNTHAVFLHFTTIYKQYTEEYTQHTPHATTSLRILIRTYRKTSNISRTLVANKIFDHSDVVGASPVGAAPTTSSFST